MAESGAHRLVQNWLGQIVEYEKNWEKSDYVTRKWVEFPVKNRDDYDEMKWRYDPNNPSLCPNDWEEAAHPYRDRTYPVNITIPSLFWRVRDWVSLKNLCIMLHRDPDLVHEMMRFWANFVLKLTRRALRDVDVDYVLLCDDMAYKGRAMTSPEMMKEFMLPHYRRWVTHFKEHGVRIVMMDSDGYLHEIAPVWMEAGINVLAPIEISAGNGMLRLREELGHRMALMGGIDKIKIAQGGRALDKEFESKVPQLIRDGGYIPCCDHYIPPNVTYAKYCHYIRLLKRYCGWET